MRLTPLLPVVAAVALVFSPAYADGQATMRGNTGASVEAPIPEPVLVPGPNLGPVIFDPDCGCAHHGTTSPPPTGQASHRWN